MVSKPETDFYLGKRIAYIYKASTLKKDSHYRVIWGKFTRSHGNAGQLRCAAAWRQEQQEQEQQQQLWPQQQEQYGLRQCSQQLRQPWAHVGVGQAAAVNAGRSYTHS